MAFNSVFHRILDYNGGGFLSGPFFISYCDWSVSFFDNQFPANPLVTNKIV